VEVVKEGISSSRPRLNASKTELIWLGGARYVKQCMSGLQLIVGAVIMTVRNIDVLVNSDLSLKASCPWLPPRHVGRLGLLSRLADAASSPLTDVCCGTCPCDDHSRLD